MKRLKDRHHMRFRIDHLVVFLVAPGAMCGIRLKMTLTFRRRRLLKGIFSVCKCDKMVKGSCKSKEKSHTRVFNARGTSGGFKGT